MSETFREATVFAMLAFVSLCSGVALGQDWVYNPATGHSYKLTSIYSGLEGWLEAEAEAVSEGGHLVTINNVS